MLRPSFGQNRQVPQVIKPHRRSPFRLKAGESSRLCFGEGFPPFLRGFQILNGNLVDRCFEKKFKVRFHFDLLPL